MLIISVYDYINLYGSHIIGWSSKESLYTATFSLLSLKQTLFICHFFKDVLLQNYRESQYDRTDFERLLL